MQAPNPGGDLHRPASPPVRYFNSFRLDVAALLDASGAALREVERLGPTRLDEFDWALAPRVRFSAER